MSKNTLQRRRPYHSEEGSYLGKYSTEEDHVRKCSKKSLQKDFQQNKELIYETEPSKKKTLPKSILNKNAFLEGILGRRFLLGKEEGHVRKYSKKSLQKDFQQKELL